jgi:hypothetical protein
LHLSKFIHQYQNEKYLMLDGFPNVVRCVGDLAGALKSAIGERSVASAYNRAQSRAIPLRSLTAVTERMVASGSPPR